jgi:hypothetical protein
MREICVFSSPNGSLFEQIESVLALIEPMLKDINP